MTEEAKSKELLYQCAACRRQFPKSQLHVLTSSDTQGYYRSGLAVCASCLQPVRYDVLTLEDEDLEEWSFSVYATKPQFNWSHANPTMIVQNDKDL